MPFGWFRSEFDLLQLQFNVTNHAFSCSYGINYCNLSLFVQVHFNPTAQMAEWYRASVF